MSLQSQPQRMSSAFDPCFVKNFMHCMAAQVHGIKCVDTKENMQLNLAQRAESLAQEIKENPVIVGGDPLLPCCLLWCVPLREKRGPHMPVCGWLSHAVQTFIRGTAKQQSSLVQECVRRHRSFPNAMCKRDHETVQMPSCVFCVV